MEPTTSSCSETCAAVRKPFNAYQMWVACFAFPLTFAFLLYYVGLLWARTTRRQAWEEWAWGPRDSARRLNYDESNNWHFCLCVQLEDPAAAVEYHLHNCRQFWELNPTRTKHELADVHPIVTDGPQNWTMFGI